MKKTLLSILAVMLVSCCMFGFVGCVAALTPEEELVVGKYEVISLSITNSSVKASDYDYFTMEFFANRKCFVKSKLGATTYEADATWKINSDGEIEVVTREGRATATEKYRLDGDIISGTNSGFVNNSIITVTVSLQRIVEE